jgi:Skp family chaperone for outer membrane proteins
MRRLSAVILLSILSMGCCATALANTGYRTQSSAARKAEKKQQKAQRKYAKAQRKAQKRMIKKDRKNTRMYPRQHY